MKFQKKLESALKSQGGFTLTEMLIVIAIIALIGSLVTTQLFSRYNKAKVDATKVQMRQIGTILDQYRLDCNVYPTTEQGLDALLEPPQTGRKCKSYDPDGYIKGGKIPKDGFDNDFIYFSDGRKYELRSLGQDGQEGGEGFDADISSMDIE